MFKKDFVQSIGRKAQLTDEQVRAVLDAGHEVTCEELALGGSVNIMGLGQIMLRPRAATTGRDVRRGESVVVPARAVVGFKPTRSVIDKLRNTDLSLLKRKKER